MIDPYEVYVPALAKRRPKVDYLGLILAVFTFVFIVFLLLPIIVVVWVSFSSGSFISFPIRSYSMRWYTRIWEYKPFIDALVVSLQVAVLSAFGGAVLGVPAALWAARSRSWIATWISNFLLAPLSVPAIVLGFSLLYLLSAIGFGISFLALVITHTVVAIPYIARTCLATYRATPSDFEEASAVLGATRWQTLFNVTLPLVRPGIFAGALFAVLISLDNLPLSFFFGSSSTNTLPVVMLNYMQNQFDPSIAAISTVQMLIAVISLLVLNAVYGIERLTTA